MNSRQIRPDPDELLKRIKQEESQLSRRRAYLKIFLGYAAGVGKTYRMLHEAIHLIAAGQQVSAAIVETHGRKEIATMLASIPAIPEKKISYGKIELTEMDLDAVIKRRPAFVLVDELAHTNVPGSKHEKRFQDVEELLGNGINVYTCLNVQHLESLNDVVYQITGIRVRETVPDRILKMADKIELVDLPTEELLQRLADGKVYIPEKAKVAVLKFFQQSNLMALREMALRLTAQRVDTDMVAYKDEQGIKRVLPTGSRLLVCVSPSFSSADVIRTAHRLAGELNAEWFAVYVESSHQTALRRDDQLQLDKNLNLARELGAGIIKLSGDFVAGEIIAFARDKNVSLIVLGFSKRSKLEELFKGSIVTQVVQKSDPIQVLVVPGTQEKPPVPVTKRRSFKINKGAPLISMSSVGLMTGVCLLLRPVLNVHDVVLLFIIPIVLTGVTAGLAGGIIASLLAALSFNFFFIPPFYTLAIRDLRFLLTFAVLIFTGTVTSLLANVIRRQSENAKRREKFIRTVNEFSRKLLSTGSFAALVNNIVGYLSELFETETALLLPSAGKLSVSARSSPALAFGERELGIAQWSYQNNKRAGFGTGTLVSSPWQFSPLAFQNKVIGVLALKPLDPPSLLTYERQRLLESFLNIVALSLENFYGS